MTSPSEPTPVSYQVGGSLPAGYPAYVERRADQDLYTRLMAGQYCFVFNSRQMGKSSLRVHTMQRLQQEGIRCAVIDPQTRGTTLREDQWYAGTIKRLVDDLRLQAHLDFRQWWRDLEEQSISAVERFAYFVDQVVLQDAEATTVIFVEEIDNLLSLKFDTDGFFSLIRSFSERRAEDPRYQRLTFAFLGVATPADLIVGTLRSSFNIGYAVEMTGFQAAEAQPLLAGLVGKVPDPSATLAAVLHWTGGQPFLTQKLLNLIVQASPTLREAQSATSPNPLLPREKGASILPSPSPQGEGNRGGEGLSPADFVAQVVQTQVIDNWEAQDVPPHLKTIRDRVLRSDERMQGRLLGLYQHVIAEDGIPADQSPEHWQLRLTGLVVQQQGRLRVYNPIYAAVFNDQWVTRALTNLRPAFYAEAMKAWQEGNQNQSFLLRGQALDDAEIWARGKRLSDEDDCFLQASREAEAKEQETRLAVMVEEAQILEAANRKAKRQIQIGSVILAAALLLAGGASVWAGRAVQQAIASRDTILQANALEKEGVNALNRSKFDLMRGLVDAMRTGERATQLLRTKGSDGFTANPIYALQTILDQVENRALQPWQHQTLMAHRGPITAAQFSPDSTRIVTASYDNTARVWDAQNGKELAKLAGHENWVYAAQFSPDGTQIVTASEDKTARVWDAQTGKELAKLAGHENRIYAAQFSPDGTQIVTASEDNTARVWDAQTGKELAKLAGHEGAVTAAQFSPDGQRIVTASADNTARVWDAQTGKELAKLTGHEDSVTAAQFSPDGKRIVTASASNTARVWDAQTGKELAKLAGHESYVTVAQFSPDSQRIVTASADNTARVWDAQSGQKIVKLAGYESSVYAAQFSPDGQRIVVASYDNTVRVWDAQSGQELAKLAGHESYVTVAQFSPDGQRIVTASYDNTVRVWDAQSGKELAKLAGHKNWVTVAQFSPDGQRIVTASADNTARVWDAQSGQELAKLAGHESSVTAAQFSPDGQRIVTASEDATARIWNAQSGQKIATLEGHESSVTAAQFSPDGQRIVTASEDATARVWNAQSGQKIATLEGHESSVTAAQFSPDGRRIVTASEDATARVWDAQSGKELAKLAGHENRVTVAQFSPDGQRIVTVSADNTARVWDAHSGQELAKLAGHESYIYAAQFSPDGQRIVTVSADNTARVWPVETLDQLLVRGCDWLHSYLIAKPQILITLPTCQTPERTRSAAPNLVADSDKQARAGNLEAAIQGLTTAKRWDPSLSFNPVARATALKRQAEAEKEARKLVGQADGLAREGKVEAAIGQYRHALTLNPKLDLDPVVQAQQVYGEALVEQGDGLAREGKVEAAIEQYRRALTLNPQLDLDPVVQAQNLYATVLVEQGDGLAQEGKVEAAIEQYRRALTLNPQLDLDPVVQAQNLYATVLVEQGDGLAQEGKVEAAIEQYRRALTLNPQLDLDPAAKAQQIHGETLIRSAIDLAKKGAIAQALATVQQVQTQYPQVKIDANSWGEFCSVGSLYGNAAQVLPICDQAVTLYPETKYLLASRGLARALTGNIPGAIADFQVFAALPDLDEEGKTRVEGWIRDLQAGKNPFTPEVLDSLKNE